MNFSLTELQHLYRDMLRIRLTEEAIAARYGEQEMRCPTHLCIGQEAICVGVAHALNRDDYVFSNHRAHGHYLAKGGNLPALIGELYGKGNGCCGGMGGSMHLIDPEAGFMGAVPIVASTIPLAVGAAWAAQLKNSDQVSVAFFGDGAFEEGVVHESLNFALLHHLPMVFVCENNLYSVYTRLDQRQPERPIHGVAAAHGCQVATADGNDVAAVVDTATQAIAQARQGKGPVFLEFSTYRWREHCGPDYDDDLGYRPQGELQDWQQHCPIQRLANQLKASGTDRTFFQEAKDTVDAEVAAAFQTALDAAPPRYNDLPGLLHG
ncbi:thiamine pyrophosphate-dependent dehydrogenase E1 component subunit alpha [Azospira sp. I09]|uniref:thiamine pyrophosphate-dependent dehydrogenase E1 component subunit alpha n=1 Tax=Azospira sp. I09 TaxID=1765049 RepID=UPI0012A1ED17|nr:thiamine pyrophosphate-dependent dehydrogenase E1 component subunit alpha [Azospira sp. I09]BBN90426.1 acetoin dehydrogenase [Azospira sp. I09]